MAYPSTSYNPYLREPRRRFGTSPTEFIHITVAMVVLSGVLWIVFDKNIAGSYDQIKSMPPAGRIAAAICISLFGFVLHELGHKFTAQHFGHWSEFRANWLLLGAAIVCAFVWGLPIAAPGATWHTAEARGDQGKISAMGPLVNYAVAFIAFPFTFGGESVLSQLAGIVVFFSAFLALFNLIPFGALDGRKVIQWNIAVWLILVVIGVGLMIQTADFFLISGP